MNFHHSYTNAFQACLKDHRFSIAHLSKMGKNMNIDTLGCYKIFFSLSGQKIFHIDELSHDCLPGDLFLISPQEWHYFSDYSEEIGHERIVFFIYPGFLRDCCSAETDLGQCFSEASQRRCHKLSLTPAEQERFLSYIAKLSSKDDFGQDLLDKSVFLECMVFLNRIFIEHSQAVLQADPVPSHNPRQINEVIAYVNHHLSEDLSTNILADRFFLSPSYLCKLFRNATGTTLHKYVTAKRVTLAKNLLSNGFSVSATCTACGFNDYSNFIKIFTKAVGISPKKYATLQKE